VPKVFVLDDLPGHLAIIPDRLPVVDLKRFVLDELPKYWVPIFNKVPVHNVLVLEDLPGIWGLFLTGCLLSYPSLVSRTNRRGSGNLS
jgi:hypothetical protein